MDNHTFDKEKVIEKLFEKYNPESIGQLEKYPPFGKYYVTLYFSGSFNMYNYYNIDIENQAFDFKISNISKTCDETMVTIQIKKHC